MTTKVSIHQQLLRIILMTNSADALPVLLEGFRSLHSFQVESYQVTMCKPALVSSVNGSLMPIADNASSATRGRTALLVSHTYILVEYH